MRPKFLALTWLSLGLLVFGFFRSTPASIGSISDDRLIALDRELEAAAQEQGANYKMGSHFLSEIFYTERPFQLLGIEWMEELPASTAATVELRFMNEKGEWSEWQALHEDHDEMSHEAHEAEEHWSYIMTSSSIAFQYQAQLSTTDQNVTPKLSEFRFDYVNGGQPSTASSLAKLVFDADPDFVSRDEWGADESVRYLSEDPGYVQEAEFEYPDMRLSSVTTEENGQFLKWPYEYSQDVNKIIIHHTASTSDLDDPETAVRAIYLYHSLTRGWGDIGYNYIVAPDGRVFEGRAGGDSVVGAHAAGYNAGSVGIAVLGNYQKDPLPKEAMQGLSGMVYQLAELHDITPDGASPFRGKSIPNILGHRDVSATSCPGDYNYDYLPDLRELVSLSLDSSRHKSASGTYAFEEEDRSLILMDPASSDTVTLALRNTGTATWNQDTLLSGDGLSARMKESSVKPGQTAHFELELEAPLSGGLEHYALTPNYNGQTRSNQILDLGVFVEEPLLSFDMLRTNLDSLVKSGSQHTVTVKLRNEGNFTWTKTGTAGVELVKVGSSELSSKSILAQLQQNEVEPGDIGEFQVQLTAPSRPGRYSLYFAPSVDGDVLTRGSGTLTMTVASADDDALVLYPPTELYMNPGERYFMWLQVRNFSGQDWNVEDDFDWVSRSANFQIENVLGSQRRLANGSSMRVYFTIVAPETPGSHTLKMQPELKGRALFASPLEVNVTVFDPSDFETDYEDPIRVKLTPENVLSEQPILTSDQNFAAYDGDRMLKAFPAGTRVIVIPMEDGFVLRWGSSRYFANGPVRFVPENGTDGVMTIMSYENRPAWNTALNDNQFRGTVELRKVNGELVHINELPLEYYLRGIAEESNGAAPEKIKTLMVLARSYAGYYLTQDEKFPGMPYTLEDDPNTSQRYLGYGFEQRAPNVVAAVEATAGQVVTYQGRLVKTPYFSQSDGGFTKSAQSVWGWTDTPWLQSVSDAHCQADVFAGHGVGLSGCGATALAERGWSYTEIIRYYYKDVAVSTYDLGN